MSEQIESQLALRGYQELTRPADGTMDAWPISTLKEEADIWQNSYALLSRMYDLSVGHPPLTKYHYTLCASVYGEHGITMRNQAVEEDDRTISAKEKRVVRSYEERWNRVLAWAAEKRGHRFEPLRLTRETDAELTRLMNGSGKERLATAIAGTPRIAANQLIQKKWNEWQDAQYCDVSGEAHYSLMNRQRLWGAVTKGELFTQLICDPSLNKFGFTTRNINPQWCDRFFSGQLENGNWVQQGIEYKRVYGARKRVAAYFIVRTPRDWQFNQVGWGSYNFAGVAPANHVRIPFADGVSGGIIHYKRATDCDVTRPAPLAASCITTAGHLSEYAKSAVIAAREACMTSDWFVSSLTHDAAQMAAMGKNADPRLVAKNMPPRKPGGAYGLPYGVTRETNKPEQPTTTFPQFADWNLRFESLGMPGASASDVTANYAALSFSGAKMEELRRAPVVYDLQQHDINTAQIPTFRPWLYMSLLTGEIPYGLENYEALCQPVFQGPRVPMVDEIEQVTSAVFRIANNLSNWTRESGYMGFLFDETVMQKAEDLMLMEKYNVDAALVTRKPMPSTVAQPASEQEAKPPAEQTATSDGESAPAKSFAEEIELAKRL